MEHTHTLQYHDATISSSLTPFSNDQSPSIRPQRSGLVGERCVLFDKTLMTAELQIKLSKTGVDLSCPASLADPHQLKHCRTGEMSRWAGISAALGSAAANTCIYRTLQGPSSCKTASPHMKTGSSSAPEPSGQVLDNAHRNEPVCKSYNSCLNGGRPGTAPVRPVQRVMREAGSGSNQMRGRRKGGERRTLSSGM